MKTSLSFRVILAVLGAAIASTSAQTQSTTVQVSKLVGTKVKSSQGEEIGVVKDVMIDRSTGCNHFPGNKLARAERVTRWQSIAQSARDGRKTSRNGITSRTGG